jgi:hypothetical protein
MILEGLEKSRVISEGSYEDTPVSSKSREMQKVISDVLNKKYLPMFKDLNAESVGAEVYVHDDSDSMVDDAIYEITLYIAFDVRSKVDNKEVEKIIAKNLRNYPKFQYDRGSKQYYATIDDYYGIIDLIDTLEKDGCRIRNLYSIVSASDIESKIDAQNKEWQAEKDEMNREYNRSRM